jgi:hypothetical protein
MATGKTSTLTFRIQPGLKETLRTAAGREHRSIANMVGVLIRDYCGRNGITMQEQQALFLVTRTAGRDPRQDRKPPWSKKIEALFLRL